MPFPWKIPSLEANETKNQANARNIDRKQENYAAGAAERKKDRKRESPNLRSRTSHPSVAGAAAAASSFTSAPA